MPHHTHEGHAFQPHLSFTALVECEFSSSNDCTAPQQIAKMTSFNNHGSVTNQAGTQNVNGNITYYLCNHGGQSVQQHLTSPTHAISCRQCKRPFGSSQALKQHIESKIHEAKCSFCTKSFPDQQSLQQHINAAHDFKCPSCKRCFKTKEALSQHTTATHTRRPTP